MKTVSAAKLRRAQERVFSARPYAAQLKSVLSNLASRIENVSHPLLEVRPREPRSRCRRHRRSRPLRCFHSEHHLERRRTSNASIRTRNSTSSSRRKSRDFSAGARPHSAPTSTIFFETESGNAKDISEKIIDAYTKAEFDAVYLIYNEFKSVIQQRLLVEKLLPFDRGELKEAQARIDYIYEQPPQEIFNRLFPRYVETQIFRALLESAAAEHGARMAAMDTATRNAGEMIDMLTLNMNRVRQAAITREIIEVVSGAGAL